MAAISVNGVTLNVEASGHGPALVLLHGFTGSTESWRPHLSSFSSRHSVIGLDALGHGSSDAPADPERYRMHHAARDIVGVLDRLRVARAAVLGYSMGARVALFLATVAPDRVAALVLESGSPGILRDADRLTRRAQDLALAAAIERDGVETFVDRWERLPLFATQQRLPAPVRADLRAQRLRNRAAGLANSLRGMGQGAQPPLVDRLPDLSMPVLVLTGALDAAYTALGRDMAAAMPDGGLVIVPDAGHTVHLEQPGAFQRAVLEFLAHVQDAGPSRNWSTSEVR